MFKTFNYCTSFIQHQRVYIEENLYRCIICGKVFILHSYLTQHLIIHTGSKLNKHKEGGKALPSTQNLPNVREFIPDRNNENVTSVAKPLLSFHSLNNTWEFRVGKTLKLKSVGNRIDGPAAPLNVRESALGRNTTFVI